MAASCFGSMWPAWSPPKISRATSPGMTRMITNTRAAAPSSVGMIRSSRFAMYVCIPPGSIFGQPDVLELLIGEVIGRRHVVLHLRPVHHGAPPPEARDVVRVVEDDLLDNAYYIPGLWWRRAVVHWAKVKNNVAPPNHFSNQKLQDVWLAED